ncbi:MAG: serine hydrolase domain-containing protein, partial [Pseudomonadota bacterium]
RGVLALDEPLAQILPHPDIQDGRAARITPRMVLSHQSGFPNWRFQNEDGQLDIKFEPGSEFLYSGEGFEYLALALAHALDTDLAGLERLMRADMRQALSCDPGPWTWSADLQARLATGYIDGQAQDDWRIESPMVSASLFSSARRYACVVSAILNGTGLSADMRAAAMSPQVVLFDDDDFRADFGLDAWGLGIAIKDTDFGRAISHGGINEGFTSWFTALRDRRAGYVFLTNSQKGPELNAAIEDELLALALALD